MKVGDRQKYYQTSTWSEILQFSMASNIHRLKIGRNYMLYADGTLFKPKLIPIDSFKAKQLSLSKQPIGSVYLYAPYHVARCVAAARTRLWNSTC